MVLIPPCGVLVSKKLFSAFFWQKVNFVKVLIPFIGVRGFCVYNYSVVRIFVLEII